MERRLLLCLSKRMILEHGESTLLDLADECVKFRGPIDSWRVSSDFVIFEVAIGYLRVYAMRWFIDVYFVLFWLSSRIKLCVSYRDLKLISRCVYFSCFWSHCIWVFAVCNYCSVCINYVLSFWWKWQFVFFKCGFGFNFIFSFKLFFIYFIIIFHRCYFYSIFKMTYLLPLYRFRLELENNTVLLIFCIILKDVVICVEFLF